MEENRERLPRVAFATNARVSLSIDCVKSAYRPTLPHMYSPSDAHRIEKNCLIINYWHFAESSTFFWYQKHLNWRSLRTQIGVARRPFICKHWAERMLTASTVHCLRVIRSLILWNPVGRHVVRYQITRATVLNTNKCFGILHCRLWNLLLNFNIG